jgi:hypothetical protein
LAHISGKKPRAVRDGWLATVRPLLPFGGDLPDALLGAHMRRGGKSSKPEVGRSRTWPKAKTADG